MFKNPLLLMDSYKPSQPVQYPPDLRYMESFFESRGGWSPEVVFFGLQYLQAQYLEPGFTLDDIDEATDLYAAHFGSANVFQREKWLKMHAATGGAFPIEVCAVPEGTVVPVSNVILTVKSTMPEFAWVVGQLESLFVQLWYPCSVATQSRHMRRRILAALRQSGDPKLIDFKLHDFGFRGSTSVESSAIGGAAHLISSMGTDTIPAIQFLRRFYHERMAGFSVPAAEHSTITSWGRDGEADAYRNILTQYPTGIVAVVSDSYDIFHACENLWGGELRTLVLKRDGMLVVRPDSGDPVEVVGKVLTILGERFGTTYNDKGYRVLNPKVRVIQGDGIDREMVDELLLSIMRDGWSADNLTFGSGGGLLQKMNRDTHKFAFKCSAVDVGGVMREVIKTPVTDPGKKSKAGRLALERTPTGVRTVRREDLVGDDLLVPTFRNGLSLVCPTFSEIRARAAEGE